MHGSVISRVILLYTRIRAGIGFGISQTLGSYGCAIAIMGRRKNGNCPHHISCLMISRSLVLSLTCVHLRCATPFPTIGRSPKTQLHLPHPFTYSPIRVNRLIVLEEAVAKLTQKGIRAAAFPGKCTQHLMMMMMMMDDG